MVSDRAAWWNSPLHPDAIEMGISVPPLSGYEESEYGPPTELDDAWFTHHVASLGYPRGYKDPVIDGQLDIVTYLANEEWEQDRE